MSAGQGWHLSQKICLFLHRDLGRLHTRALGIQQLIRKPEGYTLPFLNLPERGATSVVPRARSEALDPLHLLGLACVVRKGLGLRGPQIVG